MQQLKQLKRDHSLKIEKGMLALWEGQDEPKALDPDKIIGSIKDKKAFATGGKVLAYISKGELFITPYTQESLALLRNNGYKEFAFFVPFSPKGMVPADPGIASHWQDLMQGISFASRSMKDRRAEVAQNQSNASGDLQPQWASAAVATA